MSAQLASSYPVKLCRHYALCFSVPTDGDGVKIDALEQLILEHMDKLGEISGARPYRAMFYTVPVFNNPTSANLPPGWSKYTSIH